jgi:hypothetical protein
MATSNLSASSSSGGGRGQLVFAAMPAIVLAVAGAAYVGLIEGIINLRFLVVVGSGRPEPYHFFPSIAMELMKVTVGESKRSCRCPLARR